MKSQLGLFALFLSVSQAVEIDQSQTNQCICSDFTYLNDQGILVGNCLATLETQFGRRFSGEFCYIHQPNNCINKIGSNDLPGMEACCYLIENESKEANTSFLFQISFGACRQKKRMDARRNQVALQLLLLLGIRPSDFESPLPGPLNDDLV